MEYLCAGDWEAAAAMVSLSVELDNSQPQGMFHLPFNFTEAEFMNVQFR